jgi:hypothetical protein
MILAAPDDRRADLSFVLTQFLTQGYGEGAEPSYGEGVGPTVSHFPELL